jgi:hypothetical protein
MNARASDQDAPVLIAGGGLVGLSTAIFLAQHGIGSLVIDRLRGGSKLPRAAHFHLRTVELFRSAGIEDEVKGRSKEEFLPEGAIIAMDSLAGRKTADIISSLNGGVEALRRAAGFSSPSRRWSQSCGGVRRRVVRGFSMATRSSPSARMHPASARRRELSTPAWSAPCGGAIS